MEMHAFIGCDIGTSGTKAVATDSQGRILAQASVTYGVLKPRNNWVEQHPDVWLDAAVSTLRTVIADLPSSAVIEAICISALYGGTGALCDENMNSVRPALIWMDRRAEKESSMLRKTIGEERISRYREMALILTLDIPNFCGCKSTSRITGRRYGTFFPSTVILSIR